MFWEFVYFLMFAGICFAVFQAFFQNRIKVEPGKRKERVVITDNAGNLKVLGYGTHFLPPDWSVFHFVSTNREPVEVAAEDARTSNGPVVTVKYRYDILIGRAYDPKTGKLLHPEEADNEQKVEVEDIISAVTVLDFEKHDKYVAQRVSVALEATMGDFEDRVLITPKDEAEPWIPTQTIIDRAVTINQTGQKENWLNGLITPRKVQSASEVYEQLSELIELRVNYALKNVGINIIGFAILDMQYKDAALRNALEAKTRTKRLMEAKAGTDLSDTEAVAVGTDQYGQSAIADAVEKAGLAFAQGMASVSKGLENFHKGTSKQSNLGEKK